ncbi:MAG: polysaccharide export protein [Pseudohongiellaceae bacterium]
MNSRLPTQGISILALSIILGGCMLAPGSSLDVDQGSDRSWFSSQDGVWFPGFGQPEPEQDSAALAGLVDIYTITPELVSQQISFSTDSAVPISEALQQQIGAYDYLIGKGDTLFITVYDHPELTAPAGNQNQANLAGNVVRSDGSIFYPYAGSVTVEGMSIEDVRQELTNRLEEYITDPQVDLRVLNFRSQRAYVTGQVNQPGPRPITDVPMTILDAINQAGGLTENANWHNAQLVREDGEQIDISLYELINNGRMDQNTLMRHGDVLNVPDIGNQKVFMMGELGRVNSIPMGNLRMSLTDALSQSGGIDQVAANASGVFVIRQAPLGSDKIADVYQLNAKDALAFAMGARFMLLPADVVFVTTAPVTRWNRVLSQIVPSLSSLLLIDRLGGN